MIHAALLVASTRPTWPDILVFAATAALLVIAVVGAVVLARRPPTVHADPEDSDQSELSA